MSFKRGREPTAEGGSGVECSPDMPEDLGSFPCTGGKSTQKKKMLKKKMLRVSHKVPFTFQVCSETGRM